MLQASFIKSAAKLHQSPQDSGYEVAFAGRSNAGKSTTINALLGHKLAKTSKTPGRTQLLNFFSVGDEKRLVDLPGFGYAKVSRQILIHWHKLLQQYFSRRNSLVGTILIMDIRHPLTDLDLMMLDICNANQIQVHILLNKADKLSKSKAKQTLEQVAKQVHGYQIPISLQTFSGLKKTGVSDCNEMISKWLRLT